jgi:hypothetical protein
MNRRVGLLSVMVLLLLVSACGSLRQQAFKDTEGNSVLLVNTEPEVRKALLMTLASKGYQVESKEGVNVVKAHKVIGDGGKFSKIAMDCFLFAMGNGGTKLQVTATEEISETSSHIKVFWLILIPIPYGSYNTTAVVSTETINDKVFYASFFKEVQNNLTNFASK